MKFSLALFALLSTLGFSNGSVRVLEDFLSAGECEEYLRQATDKILKAPDAALYDPRFRSKIPIDHAIYQRLVDVMGPLSSMSCENEDQTCSKEVEKPEVYISSILRSTEIHKDSLVDRDAKPLDHDGFRAGFVFLDDNDEGYFLHGTDKIQAKKGSFVTFEGHVEHQTIIPAGAKNPVHLLGPFTLTTERSLSLVGAAPIVSEGFPPSGDVNIPNCLEFTTRGVWRFRAVFGPAPLVVASAPFPAGFVVSFATDSPSLGETSVNVVFNPESNGVFPVTFTTSDPIFTISVTVTFIVENCCDPATNAGCNGDPHFKTWRGQHFDFHGECDLVLLHSPAFESGFGLDVHIRTKLRRDMSYISSAALRIGSDVLEVESHGVYHLNGVANAELPSEFSGFEFSHTQPTDKQHVFEVYLGGRERIKLKTYKDFVSVLIEQGQNKHFFDSVGLMGDFRTGHMIARDGNTVLDDPNAFGQEWQVLGTEPSLFQTLRFPQHPMECTLPPPMEASQLRRRLLESSSVDELVAEKACDHWGEGKDDCVFDVLTTGDLEMAVVGAY
jgi:hypothetical protein